MRFTLDDVARATDGVVDGDGSIIVDGAGIDSRTVRDGELFVAIVAERDGHQFVADALRSGAPAALVSRPVGPPSVLVADTASALESLGRAARRRVGRAVIAITGSVGKTTTKDLLAAVVGTTWATHASRGSFNNELGVPLTLVGAPEGTEVAVVEMGARGAGHIAALCEVATPDIGIVTSVGAAHTELFGTLDQVATAKGELVEALPATGTAVLNGDDPRVAAMAHRTDAQVLRYGLGTGDVVATGVELDDEVRASFSLRSPWGGAEIRLPVPGLHMVSNALAAAAAALAANVPITAVAEGLASVTLSAWRMDVRRSPAGVVVVNDAYNANPMSMRAAFDVLGRLGAGRRIAVLGVMAELGDEHHEEHVAIGRAAHDAGFEVVAVGVEEYGGMVVADADAALTAVRRLGAGEGDAVLVKGSRVAGLERIAEALMTTG